VKAALVGAVTAGLVVLLLACSWLSSPQGTASVTAGVDTAVCVLNHAQEPPIQIAKTCGVAAVEDVVKILDAHTASAVREGCALRPDGGL
jgi:hypothetical protein